MFMIRRGCSHHCNANVILFSWLPGSSPDSRNDQIGPVLESIGDGVTVPG